MGGPPREAGKTRVSTSRMESARAHAGLVAATTALCANHRRTAVVTIPALSKTILGHPLNFGIPERIVALPKPFSFNSYFNAHLDRKLED